MLCCAEQIFFSDMMYTKILTQPAYSVLALLCDVGGALGFILGATILTLCEIIDFAIQLTSKRLTVRQTSTVVA